ncbi:MAG: YicC/YloC family endoribonuclease, partial [Candidatus Binatia bacterium]|nr:YicC/YloC family endoribonuclease [Candidatus Binatia bacterium]
MEYGQMKSMTGYGEAVGQGKRAKVVVQLRTLNHRHLDIQLRVPRMYLSLEEEIRQRIRQRVNRGRVDLFITRSPLKGQGRKLEMDEGLMDQYFQAMRRARRKLGLKDKIDLGLLFKLPDLFYFKEDDDLTG